MSVVSEDSAAAKRAARILVAFYIPSMPAEQLARHGIDQAELQPIFDAFAAGDVAKAIEMFSPEMADKLSVAGTPEECAEQIARDILPPESTISYSRSPTRRSCSSSPARRSRGYRQSPTSCDSSHSG